jgi:GDPmannose 4,6-dehydratase
MLQQERPEDFVIATGEQHSVRRFVDRAAAELGVTIAWQGTGKDEVGIVAAVDGSVAQASCVPGQVIVRVDPRYFRPSEVETLLGDPAKAQEKLGWRPRTSFDELVAEMVLADLEEARRDQLCQVKGFQTFNRHE